MQTGNDITTIKYLLFGNPLVLPINKGIFKQLLPLNHRQEFLLTDEVIVFPVNFTWPHRPARRGDNEMDPFPLLLQPLQNNPHPTL